MNRPVSGTATLLVIAFLSVAVHFYVGEGYGFHRDELATLDDARHLDWGYVAYPPVTPFFGRISLELFGTSLVGFRVFAAIASAISIVLTGLIARELGGARLAQIIASAAAVPFCLATGSLMQYVAFDYLCWVLTAYFVAHLIRSGNSRWWLGIGFSIGAGMLTKYSILFLVAGLIVGILATRWRAELGRKWLWIGAACSLLVFLPNLLWQINHHFISLDFLRYIHERDIRIGRTRNFLPDQLLLTLLAFPIALAGLYYLLFDRQGKQFRVLGLMYLVPLLLFLAARGRGYYLAPAYSILYAGGAVLIERGLTALPRRWNLAFAAIIMLALLVNTSLTAITVLPIAPINSDWWRFAAKNNDDLAEEIGWPDLVETIAEVRDGLPLDQRERLGILAGNYGEAGAINLYGNQYRLPKAISGTNSFWGRGYGNPPPDTVIVVGFSQEFVEKNFESWTVAARSHNRYDVPNEETTRHSEIFVCRGLRGGWPDFWKTFQRYG